MKKNENKLENLNTSSLEKLFIKGDLSVLSPSEKMAYYNEYCNRLGLDPFTQPFKLLKLDGKEVLYCDRSGTQQLSKLHDVSHEIKSREVVNDCYVVTAQAKVTGRCTESIGAVPITKENGSWSESNGRKFFKGDGTFKPLTGDALCNAMMKAETKAKRRATLDLLGLGVLDESEISSIPNAQTVDISYTEEKPKEPTIKEKVMARLREAKDLKELAGTYGSLADDMKRDSEVIHLKDELKIKLTPKKETQTPNAA